MSPTSSTMHWLDIFAHYILIFIHVLLSNDIYLFWLSMSWSLSSSLFLCLPNSSNVYPWTPTSASLVYHNLLFFDISSWFPHKWASTNCINNSFSHIISRPTKGLFKMFFVRSWLGHFFIFWLNLHQVLRIAYHGTCLCVLSPSSAALSTHS